MWQYGTYILAPAGAGRGRLFAGRDVVASARAICAGRTRRLRLLAVEPEHRAEFLRALPRQPGVERSAADAGGERRAGAELRLPAGCGAGAGRCEVGLRLLLWLLWR